MSEFDYDVFGDDTTEESSEVVKEVKEVKEEIEEKPVKKVSVSPKKVAPKVKAVNREPSEKATEEQQYDIFEEEPAPTSSVKSTEAKAEDIESYDIFSDNTVKTEVEDATSYDVFSNSSTESHNDSYYSTSDGGYQDEGGSGNRRHRTIDTGEATGLAVAAVAGAALAKSNKVPKAIKNAIDPNYQNQKKASEQQQFLNARKERQARYEQKAQAYAKSQKKPIYKRWWFWLIVGFLLLSVMVASCGDDDSSTSTTETTAVEETVATTTTTTTRTFTMDELVVREDPSDGNWYAYAGEEKALSYTGFAKNDFGLWYVVNGKVDFSKEGTEYLNGEEYVISKGKAELKTTTQPITNTNGVSKEMKDTMDSYEAFVDEYVAFMKKYENSDNAVGMLVDYSSMMAKYAEWADKLDKLEDEDWSVADMAYYEEVTLRCVNKMASV